MCAFCLEGRAFIGEVVVSENSRPEQEPTDR